MSLPLSLPCVLQLARFQLKVSNKLHAHTLFSSSSAICSGVLPALRR